MDKVYANSNAALEHALIWHNILVILAKRKRLIGIVFLSIVGAATLISLSIPPTYKSNAQILVEREPDSEKALLFRMDLTAHGEYYDWINAEPAIITSYVVASRVVKALKLYGVGEQSRFSPAGADSTALIQAVTEFQKRLIVENFRKSNVFEISYETGDPRLAAAAVNQVIATYISYRAELYNESERFKFFDEQIRIADEKLRDLEHKQAEFKRRKEVLSPQEQRGILLTRLADYEKSLTAVRTKRIGQQAKLAVIQQQQREGHQIAIPTNEASDSPSREKYIAKLKGDWLDLEIQRELLAQKFTPAYEEIVNLDKQIAATKAKIEAETNEIISMETASIRALEAEEKELQATITNVTNAIRDFAQKEFEYEQLSRGLEDGREIYSMLLKQREEARISLAKLQHGIKIRVISPAVTPIVPIAPKKKLYVGLSMVFGLFLGFGLVFMVEYVQRSVEALHSINAFERLGKFAATPDLKSAGAVHRDSPAGNGQDRGS